jgi:hypothetical protein
MRAVTVRLDGYSGQSDAGARLCTKHLRVKLGAFRLFSGFCLIKFSISKAPDCTNEGEAELARGLQSVFQFYHRT